MIQSAGLAGTPVTVWGETRQPRQQYVLYYASVLNQIGFKATPKIISDDSYFPTIGNAKTKAQTGFADWLMDFPHPADFYLLLDCKAIQPVNNQNFSNTEFSPSPTPNCPNWPSRDPPPPTTAPASAAGSCRRFAFDA